jgi:DNA repair exonuclease SbcCD ATPase subunit
LQATIIELNEAINRSQTYNQILALGVEYLKKYQSEMCPLCKTPVSSSNRGDQLKSELSHINEGEKTVIHHKRIQDLQKKKKTLEKNLSEFKFLQEQQRQILQKTEELWNQIKDLIEITDIRTETLKKEIRKIAAELESLESDMIKMKGELLKLESQGVLMKSLFTNFEKLKSSIRSALPDWNEGQGLNLLDKRIQSLSEIVAEHEKHELKLKEVKNKLLDFTQAISYHLRQEKLIRMEGELPQVQRKLEELNLKLKKLSELENALTDINNAIIQERKNCFNKILKKIQVSIKNYYEKILGHSYYQQLEIELETNLTRPHLLD